MFKTDWEPTFKCAQCHDEPSGWIALECSGSECGHGKPHDAPHSFVVKCPCWFRARADAIRKQAEVERASGRDIPRIYDDLIAVMNNTYPWRTATTLAAKLRPVPQHF